MKEGYSPPKWFIVSARCFWGVIWIALTINTLCSLLELNWFGYCNLSDSDARDIYFPIAWLVWSAMPFLRSIELSGVGKAAFRDDFKGPAGEKVAGTPPSEPGGIPADRPNADATRLLWRLYWTSHDLASLRFQLMLHDASSRERGLLVEWQTQQLLEHLAGFVTCFDNAHGNADIRATAGFELNQVKGQIHKAAEDIRAHTGELQRVARDRNTENREEAARECIRLQKQLGNLMFQFDIESSA